MTKWRGSQWLPATEDSGEFPPVRTGDAERVRRMAKVALAVIGAVLLAVLAFCLSGCAGTDPMVKRMLDRNRQVWDEDRREDLDPELVKSRESEFDAQQRYLDSK